MRAPAPSPWLAAACIVATAAAFTQPGVESSPPVIAAGDAVAAAPFCPVPGRALPALAGPDPGG
jgi:hypothetical protein